MRRSARQLRTRLQAAGQKSLADRFDDLVEHSHTDLLEQLEELDFEKLQRLRRVADRGAAPGAHAGSLTPAPYVGKKERTADGPAAARGRALLRDDQVAFALLAGGQASRLRWNGPKGTFPIGPASDRSLFRILVEHLVRAGRDFGTAPRLAVTTSDSTDAAIRAAFELADCFGLPRDRLAFACQASLPALDDAGELVLASNKRICAPPDGHGGALFSLHATGLLDAWREAGVTTVCTIQVDNPALPVVDPDLIGRVDAPGTPIATKVILKVSPHEKLGTVLLSDGRPAIIEYSEIGEPASERGTDGELSWPLGSIGVHAFDLGFLREQLPHALPLHVAHRDVWGLDAAGDRVQQQVRKFERFVFDLFPQAPRIAVVEADRSEYAPVKNHEGPESPETCRAALDRLYRDWYAEAGRPAPEGPLELSPMDALGPDDLA